MRKEILLAGVMALGSAGVAEAQSPAVEQEQLDLSGFMETVDEHVVKDADPRFFNKMERRAQNNPNGFFEVRDIPSGTLTLYFPDGLGTSPRVGVVRTQDNIMLDDVELTPDPTGPLNAFAMTESIVLDVEQDGSLGYEERPDLLNWNQIERALDTYLVEPERTRELDWNYIGASSMGPATLAKATTDNPMDVVSFSGNEFGFIRVDRSWVEIPSVGTDVPVQ